MQDLLLRVRFLCAPVAPPSPEKGHPPSLCEEKKGWWLVHSCNDHDCWWWWWWEMVPSQVDPCLVHPRNGVVRFVRDPRRSPGKTLPEWGWKKIPQMHRPPQKGVDALVASLPRDTNLGIPLAQDPLLSEYPPLPYRLRKRATRFLLLLLFSFHLRIWSPLCVLPLPSARIA